MNDTPRTDIDSDSIVGSCDCLTKSPEAAHHKKGCKYRLIMERDTLRTQLAATSANLEVVRNLNTLTNKLLMESAAREKLLRSASVGTSEKEVIHPSSDPGTGPRAG